jgi:hypothetical protein
VLELTDLPGSRSGRRRSTHLRHSRQERLPARPACARPRRPVSAGGLLRRHARDCDRIAAGGLDARGAARFVTGAAVPVPADVVFLKQLIEAGTLRNVIGRAYSLSEIAEAHRYAQSGHKVGNVAVVVADRALQPIDPRPA